MTHILTVTEFFQPPSGASFSIELLYLLFLLFSVSLQQPSISVTSPDGGLAEVPEGREIMKGYSLIFTCSNNERYSGGVFNLIFDSSNMKHMKHTKTSVNSSASFSFPAADFGHEGRYSCVYEITLTEGTFTSPEAEWIYVSIICKLSRQQNSTFLFAVSVLGQFT